MSIWLVIPVKNFADAKQRLSGALSQPEREALYQNMLQDVLLCVTQINSFSGVALITRDPKAIKMANEFGASVFREPVNRSHTAAVRFAVEKLLEQGVQTMLTLPGDVPLISRAEVDILIAAHYASSGFTIVPAHDLKGSNAVMCSPPDVIPLQFGADSYIPHLKRIRQAGIEPEVVPLSGIGLDIDTPDDLIRFATRHSDTRTQRYLNRSGIAARILSR